MGLGILVLFPSPLSSTRFFYAIFSATNGAILENEVARNEISAASPAYIVGWNQVGVHRGVHCWKEWKTTRSVVARC
jgi:hypothetical protein